jgi:hypothetical protein
MLNGKAPFVVPDDEAAGIPRAYGRSYAEITVQVCNTDYLYCSVIVIVIAAVAALLAAFVLTTR